MKFAQIYQQRHQYYCCVFEFNPLFASVVPRDYKEYFVKFAQIYQQRRQYYCCVFEFNPLFASVVLRD